MLKLPCLDETDRTLYVIHHHLLPVADTAKSSTNIMILILYTNLGRYCIAMHLSTLLSSTNLQNISPGTACMDNHHALYIL